MIWEPAYLALPMAKDTRVFLWRNELYCSNDWNRPDLQQVILLNTDQVVPLVFFCQFDATLNPNGNAPASMNLLLQYIKRIIERDNPVITSKNDIHEIRFPDIFIQSKHLPIIWDRVHALLEKEKPVDLRVNRRSNGCILQDWFMLFDHNILLSVAPPHLMGNPMKVDDAIVQKKIDPLKGKSIHLTERLLQLTKGYLADEKKIMSVTPMYEDRANLLMPLAVRIITESNVCCFKVDHGISCSHIDVRGQEGIEELYCASCQKTCTNTLDSHRQAVYEFIHYFWSFQRWLEVLNTSFTQLANGEIIEKMIDEYSSMIYMSRRAPHLIQYMKGNKYITWGLTKKGEEQWMLKDAFTAWMETLSRARCKSVAFNPELPPGRSGDFLNLYDGFAFKPIPPEDGAEAAPLFRKHILEVICNGNHETNEFLLNCLAKMIRYPWMKLKIAIVLVSKQGAGKNTFLDVMKDMFGKHGIEITQQRHATGNFNNHLRNRLFVVLNEATWGGDKQSEGTFKAAITEYSALFESKGIDARDGINHWSFFVSSNEKWCVPATADGRRFSIMEVSNARIGDFEYFNQLHAALHHEKHEFLWFLLNRPVSRNWEPSQHMPPRTDGTATQILEDRTQNRLKWLVEQLKEFGEWSHAGRPIIQRGQSTKVEKEFVRKAWLEEAKHDHYLLKRVGETQGALTKFFNETLGECFKSRAELTAAEKKKNQPTSKWFYEFDSAENIKAHIANNYLKVPNYFEEEAESPQKKHKVDDEE
jgi:hypothetical protein